MAVNAVNSADTSAEPATENVAAEVERLRNQDPLLDSMVRRAQLRAEHMQWSLQPHVPLASSKLRPAGAGMKFPRLEDLTVLELKQFILSIPDYLDEIPIHYVDFGGWEEPRYYLDKKAEPGMVIRGKPEETVVQPLLPRHT
jgi:hypothetical protein